MRWMVGSLVVINILVLIWQLLSQQPQPEQAPQVRPTNGGAADIRLLSELDEGDLQAMRAKSTPTRSQAEVLQKVAEPLCTLVGPFEKLLRAEYFVERLQALDVVGEIQELDMPGELGYWVYLPSLASRREAFDKLRELQSRGIDSYVIPRGELENGISFGMFSQENLAKARLEDMRKQGYEAQLQEVERSYKETWVVIQPSQAQLLDPESWQSVLENENGLQRRQNYCPPVASEGIFP